MLQRLAIPTKLVLLLLAVALPTALAVAVGAGLVRAGQQEMGELAETELSFARVFDQLLRHPGYPVERAMDLAQARACLAEGVSGLRILDLGIPIMDGYSLVEALRKGGPRSVPLLVYPGRDLSEAEREELRLGMSRHRIESRTTPEQFVETVSELVKAGRVKSSPEEAAA